MDIKRYITGKLLDAMLGQMAECTHPSVFNDPVAEKIEWTPLQRGGANFQTHKLVIVQRDRMEFRASLGMVLFALLFVLVGVGMIIFAFFPHLFLLVGAGVSLVAFFAQEWPAPFVLFGLVFLGAGSAVLYFSTNPVIFDKRKGFFWKGRKTPYESGNWRKRKDCVRLGES